MKAKHKMDKNGKHKTYESKKINISKKIFIGFLVSSCLFFCFYQYKKTISTLEGDVALQELRNITLTHRLEYIENSLQKMGASLAQQWIKTVVQIEDIKKGYSFIQTNAGVMAIWCIEEPNENNSYVGKFYIGNPNNYIAKEITISRACK